MVICIYGLCVLDVPPDCSCSCCVELTSFGLNLHGILNLAESSGLRIMIVLLLSR